MYKCLKIDFNLLDWDQPRGHEADPNSRKCHCSQFEALQVNKLGECHLALP